MVEAQGREAKEAQRAEALSVCLPASACCAAIWCITLGADLCLPVKSSAQPTESCVRASTAPKASLCSIISILGAFLGHECPPGPEDMPMPQLSR